MQFEREVQFLGLEEKKITKGDRAGQTFYICKFIVENDVFEIMIFDNTTLIAKLMNLQRFQEFIATITIKQVQGDLKWQLDDLTV